MNATMRTFLRMSKEAKLFCVGILGIGYAIFLIAANYRYMVKRDFIYINEELAKNEVYSSDNINEEFCRLDINAGFGTFYVEPSGNRHDRGDAGTYYIAYLEDGSVMAVKLNSGINKSDLEMITSETDVASGKRSYTTITVEGRVTDIKTGMPAKKYEKALKQQGIIDGDLSNVKVRYYSLNARKDVSRLWIRFLISLIVGVGALFGNAILYMIKKRNDKIEGVVSKEEQIPVIQEYEPIDFDPSNVVNDDVPKTISISGRDLLK
ncbi:MAG: hypothetical protein J6O17_06720 [Eubacterium sp.]|nr:hypothetical protein [Eubacterium sp.]